ncbi:channel protein, hemolysin III family [Candidatus Vecturithrix granuli]|uniref:Channel protein, hemolysin III family n=1 Tax=Vecturithrix granuli TaxID=1499967 RepID=A0A081C3G9_VECG1|nr:channel protein, hemolysin III family [Candidatus Vecturithrix granuli]
MNNSIKQHLVYEELANSITHGIGIYLGVAGLAILVVFASLYGNAWHIVSCSIYGVTLVLLYTASTLYHSFRHPQVKHVFRIIDHASIYLLIAGTYTPFTLVPLRGAWGWSLFSVIWILALGGIITKIFFIHRFEIFSRFLYLIMGWIVVVAGKPMLQIVPARGILWLVIGGLSYTIGIIFYALDKKFSYAHAIWHVFVLVGSICHFFAVMFYVVPHPI